MSRILGRAAPLSVALLATVAASAAANPGSVAVGPDGTAYSADIGTSVVTKLALDGTVGDSFGGRGTAAGQFGGIAGLDVDKDTGNVWVIDDANRLQELTAAGAPLRSVVLGPCTETPNIFARGGVSVGGNYVFVSSACNDTVVRLNKSDLGGRVSFTVNDAGGLSYNQFASGGYKLAVADPGGKQVKLYTDAGTFVRDQAVGGTVTDVELDDFGVVFANDLDAKVIHLYGTDGAQFRVLGGPGSDPGKLNDAIDFDVFFQYGGDLAGNLFIADHGNNRVQRWNSYGYTFYAKTPGAQTPGGGGTTPPVDPPAPTPTGRVGVSVANGAAFVSSPAVNLNVIAPAGTTKVLLSNDGGFANAVEKPYAASNVYTFTLASSGAERLPKTVYVRFLGSGDDTKTFTDDVILDQTAPALRTVTATGGATARAAIAATKAGRTTTVRLKASDSLSGVRFAQIALKPGGRTFTTRYARVLKAKAVGPRPYVRVIDAAGNASKWVRASRAK